MNRRGLRLALLGALCLAALSTGCRQDVTGLDSDNSALVYGTVSDPGGKPVDSATVETTAFPNLCGSKIATSSTTRTDANGRYADTLLFFRSRFRGCLSVRAVPLSGDGLRSTLVELATRSITGPGLDSINLDLTLDSVPAR